MCLIVDANRVALVFTSKSHVDIKPVWDWLNKGGALVYGGKLLEELNRHGEARRALVELKRAGRAFEEDPQKIARELSAVEQLCGSNDAHVIALARASGARLLLSGDHLAIADFKNKSLISKPRGKVYSSARHKKILCHSQNCRRPKAA